MKTFENETWRCERALYAEKDVVVKKGTFLDGESAVKESSDIKLEECTFAWKYPVWYSNNINISYSTFTSDTRAGFWYCNNVTVNESKFDAPKCFRKCDKLYIADAEFTNGNETLWNCSNVDAINVKANGDYFAMGCSNIEITNLYLDGKYSFDGVKNAKIINSTIIGRDAFWNCENIEVYDSVIKGEYIGWNTKNLKFVNCKIESLQGLCYIENLVMENCVLEGTSLAFEYSTVNATVNGSVDSILNPTSGTIKADSIGVLILEKDKSDFKDLKIECPDVKLFADSDATAYF